MVLIVTVVVAFYLFTCLVWPFGKCRRCKGVGKFKSPFGKAYRHCGKCKGSGLRVRLGRHVINHMRAVRARAELHQQGRQVTPRYGQGSLHPAASRWIELWNGQQALGWDHHGTPVFRFRWAPAGLATRRQLRAMRMSPGGQEPYALLVWRNGKRWAWLYRLDLASPSRVRHRRN